jgi:Fur family transcriptional regulator, ferric uptake regulator
MAIISHSMAGQGHHGVKDIGDVHDAVAKRVRAAEQIYTSGRRDLIELLARVGRPATIPDLLEASPRLTQSSLYRNLAVLETVGVVQKVTSTDDRARYELSDDLMGHHHHLICTSCGRVDDFTVPTRAEQQLEAILTAAIGTSGFRPSGHRLDLVGVCRNCAA